MCEIKEFIHLYKVVSCVFYCMDKNSWNILQNIFICFPKKTESIGADLRSCRCVRVI